MVRYTTGHVPVLLNSVREIFSKPLEVFVDGTLGGGGHFSKILVDHVGLRLAMGFDLDIRAIRTTQSTMHLPPVQERPSRVYSHTMGKTTITLVNDSHERFTSYLAPFRRDNVASGVDGMLLDLGVSSMQLDAGHLSFRSDCPLDLRFTGPALRTEKDSFEISSSPVASESKSTSTGTLTAWHVVNEWPAEHLMKAIVEFGGESEAAAEAIVGAVMQCRSGRRVQTNRELAKIISTALMTHTGRPRHLHPATKTFQALRIVVNDELGVLSRTLGLALSNLSVHGRLCVISFHYGEDTLVKRLFKEAVKASSRKRTLPQTSRQKSKGNDLSADSEGFHPTSSPSQAVHLPGSSDKKFRLVGRAVRPLWAEVEENPRARSAILRCIERVS
eukprot:Rmarinus@m.14075